jgi:hypothetical protein
MALVLKDRVKESSATTGTGTLTLSGAASGFETFSSSIGNGNTTYYAILNGAEWEVGVGTVGAGTLSRDTVLESSNADALVNFSAGTKDVFCTYAADRAVSTDLTQTLTNKTISGASNTLSNIGNSSLTNSAITINGSSVSLGGSASVGTVTSVTGTSPVASSGGNTPAISLASGYGDTQNPYASKTANFVLAAPNGTAGVPTFRAIVVADIPTLNQNTTGTASNVTGTVAVANGGTGNTTGFKLFDSSFTSNIDANVNRTAGAYGSYAASATNTPTTSGILYNFTSGTSGTGDGGQFWQDYVTNNLYLRQRWGGSYGSWLTILSSSNYNSYAPTLTGTGASGTWGISITGSSATSAGSSIAGGAVYENSLTISSNYTMTSGKSGMSAGTITVNSGVTVTIPSGSRWVIL